MIGNRYKYQNSDNVFVLKNHTDHIYEFECGHRITNYVFCDLINLRTNIQNYKINTMKKLKRGFEASKETEIVTIEGQDYEIANLLKSGITNQTTVLLKMGDLYAEIDVLNLGGDNSDLKAFKLFVEGHNLKLSDLGIEAPAEKIDYELKHSDFEALQAEFPAYDYIKISVLNSYMKESKQTTGMYAIREVLKMLTRDNKTISDYIEEHKQMVIKHSSENYPGEKQFNEETMPKIMETVVLNPTPEQETIFRNSDAPSAAPAKKPVSIQTIGNLTPDRIAELQGLKEKQLQVVTDNPFVKITDSKSLKQAKINKANLLKASTDTEKIETNATKYLNAFKDMIKTAILPHAKITRDAHKLQADEITAYENAEAIRIQNENATKLKKIQDRTDELFAIPMVFNGTIYTIGTLYILPSQIENATDDEFTALVVQGKAIKIAMDSADKSKDDEIAELKRKLALLENMSNTDEVVQEAPHEFKDSETATEINEPVIHVPGTESIVEFQETPLEKKSFYQNTPVSPPTPMRFKPSPEYVMPQPNNVILNKFDLDYVDVIQKTPMPEAFIKCRAYFIEGAKQTAEQIQIILNDTDVTVKKSVRIAELCEILKNQL